MNDNFRVSTGLMFSIGLINIGISVSLFDGGEDFELASCILILGFTLIGCGIWSFYNVLKPTICTAIVYLLLFVYLLFTAPIELLFNKASIMYYGLILAPLIGSIKDALSLKDDKGI